jgi:DUF4097 and DUF4098 domain-containing protein YvlB
MTKETTQKTFQVSALARLNLSNIRGSVDIRLGANDQIEVTAVKHTESGDSGGTEIELSQAADGSVTVATHFHEGWWLWLVGSKPCRVDYIVRMPRNSTMRVRGVSNSALLDGLNGEFDIRTVSGDLTLQNLTGLLQVNSVSGKVSIKNLAGKLDLTTVSGDVNVRESKLTEIQAGTTNGGLDLQTALFDGPYRFNSVSGDVTLRFPPETRCSARLNSVSGKIVTSLPVSTRSFGRGEQVIDLQVGGVQVAARSVSGNLYLSADGNAQPAPAVDLHAILEKLERGEINPNEALKQMQN